MGSARNSTAFRRIPILILALVVVGVAVTAFSGAIVLSGPAMAQEQSWSLRDLLFLRKSPRVQPLDRFPAPPKARKPRAKRPPPVAEAPVAQIAQKAPDARIVLVIGDFMASGLAGGLEAAFDENPGVRIVSRANGSSGFVRDDYYDWPKQVGAVIAAEKPSAVIIMIGSNDRQQMQIGDVQETPFSDAWTKQYEARTEALGKAITQSKVPLLWVGMPAFKTAKTTSDMLALNDIYRSTAQDNGGEFIDVWDGFVDENGAFVTTGPDMNGQPVRLRADDGINLTKAGKRKLAFYTEKPLLKALGLAAPAGAAVATAPAAGEPVKEPALVVAPVATDRTLPMLLDDPALDGGTELLGAAHAGKASKDALAITGIGSTASPGRADDFSSPQKREAATPLKTTAVSP